MQTHSYTILPLLAAQLLHHFTPSILHCFSPHTWRRPVMNRQPLYPQLVLLNLHTTNACSTLDGLYIWIILVRIAPSHQINPSHLYHFTPQNKLPPNSYTFLPPWQPCSYLILTPLNKLPPLSYTILPPLAANSWLILLPLNKVPPHSYTISPPGRSTLRSFYPLWTSYPLTLTPFYPPWQPNSLLILPPLNKLPPHSYSILPPWQPNS